MPYSIRKVCKRCSIIYKVLAKEIKKSIEKMQGEDPVKTKAVESKIANRTIGNFKRIHP